MNTKFKERNKINERYTTEVERIQRIVVGKGNLNLLKEIKNSFLKESGKNCGIMRRTFKKLGYRK